MTGWHPADQGTYSTMAGRGLGRDELILVAATAAATLGARMLCARCAGALPPTPPLCRAPQQQQQRPPSQEEVRPPFPPEVVALLRSCALCYLSTVSGARRTV